MSRELPENFQIPKAHVSIPSHVVYRAFAAETVILNLETGTYHGLNATGGKLLEILSRCGNLGEALIAFANDYGKQPVEVEQDIRVLCTRLFERGLIDIALDGRC